MLLRDVRAPTSPLFFFGLPSSPHLGPLLWYDAPDTIVLRLLATEHH